MEKELKENSVQNPMKPFMVTVGNLRAYTEGDFAENVILDFPQGEENIRRMVDKVTDSDSKTMIVLDIDYREDCRYIKDFIGDFLNEESINELNMIAKLIGDEPHPAVKAYLQEDFNLSLTELANLFIQESEIPYYPYEFNGSNNSELMERLSEEEKMGYTYIESISNLLSTLENLQINETSVLNYLDVEAVGRDMASEGSVVLTKAGYYDCKMNGPDLSAYTMDEIKAELAEREQKQQEKISEKNYKKSERSPSMSPSL